MSDGWISCVLAGIAGLVVPIAIASTVHDMSWQAFVPAAAAAAFAAIVGLALQQSGVKARTEDKPRDRHLAWIWHHPLASSLSTGLLHGSILALYSTMFDGEIGRFSLLWPLYAVAGGIGGFLGRYLPWTYGGDDPDIPARWRRAQQTAPSTPRDLEDPRRPRW